MTESEATRLFYQHVWPHRAMVLRTARFLARRDAEADDLAQETLVKAFKFISQLDTGSQSDSRAWLSAILRNTWIDQLRAANRHAPALSLDQEELDITDNRGTASTRNVSNPAALLEHLTDADLIAALRTLPEEIRWTLLLVDVEQLDQSQAAKILGIPEGTVKSRAHRGRKMLREQILAQGPRQFSPGDLR